MSIDIWLKGCIYNNDSVPISILSHIRQTRRLRKALSLCHYYCGVTIHISEPSTCTWNKPGSKCILQNESQVNKQNKKLPIQVRTENWHYKQRHCISQNKSKYSQIPVLLKTHTMVTNNKIHTFLLVLISLKNRVFFNVQFQPATPNKTKNEKTLRRSRTKNKITATGIIKFQLLNNLLHRLYQRMPMSTKLWTA